MDIEDLEKAEDYLYNTLEKEVRMMVDEKRRELHN